MREREGVREKERKGEKKVGRGRREREEAEGGRGREGKRVERGKEGGERGWEMGEDVMEWAERKKDLMMTSLDSKILRAIEQRKLKVCRFSK